MESMSAQPSLGAAGWRSASHQKDWLGLQPGLATLSACSDCPSQGVLRQHVTLPAETTAVDVGVFQCQLRTPPINAIVSGWRVVIPEMASAKHAAAVLAQRTGSSVDDGFGLTRADVHCCGVCTKGN